MAKSVRYLNGYRLIYEPNHPQSMKSDNWNGYIYEHVFVMENELGRPLQSDEVVHHLDGNKTNNRTSNLIVLLRSQHAKIEYWLSCGAPSLKSDGENRMNSGKPNWNSAKFCKRCDKALQNTCKNYCSKECSFLSSRKVERPSKEELISELKGNSIFSIGRKYGVSDNAIRKWMKFYDIPKAILSQVTDTLVKGAETTGEVKSS